MSVKVEKLEHNMAKLTIEASADEFENSINIAYEKQKNSINMQGFRKGKVPRAVIEKMYGVSIFYEEAANDLIPKAYQKAVEEAKDIVIVSRPEIEVVQIEKGKPFIFTATVALRPEVKLGEYKGLEVKKQKIEVTDEEIENTIKAEQTKNARTVSVTDRPVENGDDILLDFEGFVDGEAFEGGKAEKFPLSVGSHSFIEGFEEQIVGHSIGEDFEVNVTFPEDYSAENLKGKPAVFKCKVEEINGKDLPEVNDEFASEVSEFDTLQDWKKEIKDNIKKSKESAAKRAKEDELIDKIVENAQMDIPDAMIDLQIEQMIIEFQNSITSQGMSMEQYLQYTGLTSEKMKEEMKPRAKKRIESSLVLAKIAETENIEVTDDDVEKEITKMAEMYKMEAKKLKELISDSDIDQIKQDLKIQKAVDIISDSAIEK